MNKRVIQMETGDRTNVLSDSSDTRRRLPFLNSLGSKAGKGSSTVLVNKLSKLSTMNKPSETAKQVEDPIPIPTRIFLYIQLREIVRLPTYDRMKIELDSVCPLTKLEHHYTTDNYIDLNEAEKPTFSITITQDSLDNLNQFCDSPLRVTLYRVVREKIKHPSQISNVDDIQNEIDTSNINEGGEGEVEGEEEEQEDIDYVEKLEPVSEGFIDLLNFLSKKRSFVEIKTFLYPLYHDEMQLEIGTTLATFHLYTLLPLLKNLNLTNMCYISLESIYNYPTELDDNSKELVATLSFQCKIKGMEHIKNRFCSFKIFAKSIIDDQDTNLKWEQLKNDVVNNIQCLSVQSGFKVRTFNLFQDLLCTEGVNFQFNEIDKATESALVCNSIHRFLMIKDVTRKLEDAIAFDEYEIIIEIYRESNPSEILLQGKLDLSVFVYPDVNSCRFAVELASTRLGATSHTSSKAVGSAKSDKQRSKSIASARPQNKPTFCIIKICLLAPITMDTIDIQSTNSNLMKKEKLKRCSKLIKESPPRAREVICEEAYREFDELVEMLIQYIANHNIKSLTEGKNFLCCNLGNIVNKMMKIMACDFNVRFPTKTNIEFTNLMTTVYKELEHRMYNLVQGFDAKNQQSELSAESKIIAFMTVIKYLYEVGDLKMCECFYEKIKNQFHKNVMFYYYTFLWDVEKKNFDAARQYFLRPLKDKVLNVEHFCDLTEIYMDYVEELEDDEKQETALEHVLRKLEIFNQNYSRIIDGWILLYCFYKNCKYQAGITYTRWKYENLSMFPRKKLPDIPKTRWEIYNSCELNFHTSKTECFYETVKIFLCLGLYKFGEIVYAEIAKENTEIERYFMTTTFKTLLGEVDKKYVAKTFPTEKMVNGDILKAFNAQISGSLDYYRESFSSAMNSYGRLIEIHTLPDMNAFQLGLLRYGYKALEEEEYESAIKAFGICCTHMEGNRLVPYFEMGKVLYKLGRLPEALKQFSECTKFDIHVPDIWGYLALINLKMGNNFNALECWKYAKLNPENIIGEDVLKELEKIPYSDVFLYVDIPKSL